MIITQQELKNLFSYSEDTGRFLRLYQPARGLKNNPTGSVAGNGYLQLKFGGKVYAQHRLAWLYVYGKLPDGVIDHINGDRADNRISNLRDVDQSTNLQNRRAPKKTSAHQLLGVSFDKRRGMFVSRIRVNGKNISLGQWATDSEAHIAYINAKRRFHAGNTL